VTPILFTNYEGENTELGILGNEEKAQEKRITDIYSRK